MVETITVMTTVTTTKKRKGNTATTMRQLPSLPQGVDGIEEERESMGERDVMWEGEVWSNVKGHAGIEGGGQHETEKEWQFH